MSVKIKNILRWLAVIPSFVGGLLLGPLMVNIFFWISNWMVGLSNESGYAQITYWIISSIFGGLLSIYWGVKTAPSNRKVVAIILEILVVIIAVLAFLGGLYTKENGVIWPLLSALALIGGSSYSLYQYYEDGENYKLFD
jgi:LytS/YehU family sensor histidine kinase